MDFYVLTTDPDRPHIKESQRAPLNPRTFVCQINDDLYPQGFVATSSFCMTYYMEFQYIKQIKAIPYYCTVILLIFIAVIYCKVNQ